MLPKMSVHARVHACLLVAFCAESTRRPLLQKNLALCVVLVNHGGGRSPDVFFVGELSSLSPDDNLRVGATVRGDVTDTRPAAAAAPTTVADAMPGMERRSHPRLRSSDTCLPEFVSNDGRSDVKARVACRTWVRLCHPNILACGLASQKSTALDRAIGASIGDRSTNKKDICEQLGSYRGVSHLAFPAALGKSSPLHVA